MLITRTLLTALVLGVWAAIAVVGWYVGAWHMALPILGIVATCILSFWSYVENYKIVHTHKIYQRRMSDIEKYIRT